LRAHHDELRRWLTNAIRIGSPTVRARAGQILARLDDGQQAHEELSNIPLDEGHREKVESIITAVRLTEQQLAQQRISEIEQSSSGQAFQGCDEKARKYSSRSHFFYFMSLLVIVAAIFGWVLVPQADTAKALGLLSLTLIGSGALAGQGRYYAKLAARFDLYATSFLRVRVAALNQEAGYNEDIRRALLTDLFKVPEAPSSRRIKSPAPGHPGSDLAAALMNKLVDNIDLSLRPSISAPQAKDGNTKDSGVKSSK